MPYVGRSTDKISNVEVLDNITFDGSSSYTLQKGGSNFTPSSANTLLVSIDGVVQAGNFTVSGSTIDFGTAVAGTSTCDFILHYGVGLITAPSDGTVTEAKIGSGAVTEAKIGSNAVTNAKMFSGFANGITMADQWRLTADLTNPGSSNITANLERVDDATFGTIGTGMTESSGVFTFPSTGIYRIQAIGHFYISGSDGAAELITSVSSDSGSSYDVVAAALSGNLTGSQTYNTHPSECFVDVTDASTFRVKFETGSMAACILVGQTNYNVTSFSFIRLGDT